MPVLASGVATFTTTAEPDLPHNGLSYLHIAKDIAAGWLFIPITAIPVGATLVTATLTAYRKGAGTVTPTIVAQAAAGYWGASSTTVNDNPGTIGATASFTGALVNDADPLTWTVTGIVNTQRTAGAWFGVQLTQTDTGAPVDLYSFASAHPPTLTLVWTVVPPDPTNLQPSGGRIVATNKPPVTFDAANVTALQIQISASGNFASPDFDSGTVVTTVPEYALAGSSYAGLTSGADTPYQVRYKNTSGIWSSWVATSMKYLALGAITLSNPSPNASYIVNTDTPAIHWNFLGGIQKAYRVRINFPDDPTGPALFDTRWVTSTATTVTLPDMVIRDSSDMLLTIEIRDQQARQTVTGFGAVATLTQTFSFQGTPAVKPPDNLVVTQIGDSPFFDVAWTRVNKPDSWQIRRDGFIIAGQSSTGGLVEGTDGYYHFIDYTAGGGTPHHWRVEAKVGDQVSTGAPTFDAIAFPKAVWVGNRNDPGNDVEMWTLDQEDAFGDWTRGEVVGTYYPLRGSNAIVVTQGQRGYEGSINNLYLYDDPSLSTTARQFFNFLEAIKTTPNPTLPYIVALPYMAFEARLSGITARPYDDQTAAEVWQVTFQFAQQGDLLWLGREPISDQLKLLLTVDYEEGTDGAAVTTTTQPYAHQTSGAPKYEADAAVHGSMGMRIPAASGGGWMSYPIPYIGTASVYFTPRTSSDRGALVRADPITGVGNVFYINLRGGGDLDIANGTNDSHAKSHGIYGWTLNKTARADFQWTWDNGTVHVVTRLFTSRESISPADEWEATFPTSLAPGYLAIGNGTSTKETDYDTVRIWAGNGSWPGALVPGEDPVALWSIPGNPTQSGFTVISQVQNVDTIQLAVSTTLTAQGDPDTPLYYDPDGDPEGVVITPEGLVSHTVGGYNPATTLYAKLAPAPGVFIGNLIQTTTDPAPDTTISYRIAFASCQRTYTGSQTQLTWEDMLAWGPHAQLFIGDRKYDGGQFTPASTWQDHLASYTNQFLGIPAMTQQLARAIDYEMADDHEISADNGESNESTDTGKVRVTSIQAMQRIFAGYPLSDPRERDSKRALYGSKMIGNHIRLVFIDSESLDRSLGTDDDTTAKTFLGAEQDTWLRNELRKPAAVNLIVCPKAMLGDADYTREDVDKPPAYTVWRTALMTWIASNSTTDGKPIHTYILGGDRHFNAYLAGSDNPLLPGHPFLVSSGAEQFALSLHAGEDAYTDEYGAGDHTLNIPVVQWVKLTLNDTPSLSGDGSGTVSITAASREVENTWSAGHQTDPSTWLMVDGFSHTDTWAYTAQPGQLLAPWAGDATQSTVEVSALTDAAWSVGLDVSLNPDMSAPTVYTSSAPDAQGWNKWSVTGLPAGRTIYYRFTDTLPAGGATVPIGDVYTCRTLQAVGTPCTIRIAVGSCAQTAPSAPYVWADMLDWAPDRVMHLGDFGYPGFLDTTQASHKTNWAVNAQGPGQVDVHKACCMDYIISDHDDNGSHRYWPGGNGATFNDAVTKANLQAWAAVVPARMDDTRALPPTGTRDRRRSEVEGRVRFLKVDTRSLEREDLRQNGVYPNKTPAPTMLGADQLAWVRAQIDAAKTAGELVVIFTDPAWNGSVTDVLDQAGAGTGVPISYSDKWPTYYQERDAISDYADSKGVPVFIAFGDSHLLEQDDGTNERNGFASICCGPFDQNMHAHFQDSYEWNYPHGIVEGGHHYPHAQQYQRLTITDDGSTITVTAEARSYQGGVMISPSETVNGHRYGTMVKQYRIGGGSQALQAVNPGNQVGTVGDTVALQLHATGGTQPYTWNITGDPSGTTDDTDGLIAGTLTIAETDAVTAIVTDADSATSEVDFSWLVNPTAPPVLTVNNPGNQTSTVGDTVALVITASGGVAPYTWTATGLPAGLSIRKSSGKVVGSPTTAGVYAVTVTAKDSTGTTATASFTWTVNEQQVYQPPSGSILPDVTDGEAFRKSNGGNTHWNFAPGSGGGYQT